MCLRFILSVDVDLIIEVQWVLYSLSPGTFIFCYGSNQEFERDYLHFCYSGISFSLTHLFFSYYIPRTVVSIIVRSSIVSSKRFQLYVRLNVAFLLLNFNFRLSYIAFL